jgi:hypothetical protein
MMCKRRSIDWYRGVIYVDKKRQKKEKLLARPGRPWTTHNDFQRVLHLRVK